VPLWAPWTNGNWRGGGDVGGDEAQVPNAMPALAQPCNPGPAASTSDLVLCWGPGTCNPGPNVPRRLRGCIAKTASPGTTAATGGGHIGHVALLRGQSNWSN
jgi:hypothetical protein